MLELRASNFRLTSLPILGFLLILLGVGTALAYYPVRALRVEDYTAGGYVRFSASRRQVHVGSCMNLSWSVARAKAVWLDNELQPLRGKRQVCPSREVSPTLRVQWPSGTEQSYPLPISVVSPQQDMGGNALRLGIVLTVLGLIIGIAERWMQAFEKTEGEVRSSRFTWVALASIGIVAVFAMQPLTTLRPFDSDNVLALSLASEKSPWAWWTGQIFSFLPGYRPLPYTLTWLQYQWVGLQPLSYFVVNAFILSACAIAFLGLLYQITGRIFPSLLAALLFLVDLRTMPSLYWIGERQSSLAALMGLLALLIMDSPRPYGRGASIHTLDTLMCVKGGKILSKERVLFFGLCLLGAALSKEYALAFLLAAMVELGLNPPAQSRWYWVTTFLIGVGYMVLRLLAGAIHPSAYTEDIGFFFASRSVDYSHLSFTGRLAQYSYNALATLFGTLLPSFFSGVGALRIPSLKDSSILLLTLPILACFWLGLRKQWRIAMPFAALILGNALLSFLIYRGRNHLVGLIGLYGIVGLGLAWIAQRTSSMKLLTVVCGWLILVILGQGIQYRRVLQNLHVTTMNAMDPCESLDDPDISPKTIEEIKRFFGLPNPTCQGAPSS